MGGWNSGGGRGAPKTSDFTRLDIAELRASGMLRPGRSGTSSWSRNGVRFASIGVACLGDHLRLSYRSRAFGAEWEEIDDEIPLAFTRPHYGGERAWFICPGCRRRRRVLLGGRLYRCRECYGATYDSQYQLAFERALSRAQDIRERLGGDTCIDHQFPPKPPRMHRRTYDRLRRTELRARRACLTGAAAKFGASF